MKFTSRTLHNYTSSKYIIPIIEATYIVYMWNFFKTTYFFYKSTLNDINNKKDYSETEPFIKIIVRRFSDSTKILISLLIACDVP